MQNKKVELRIYTLSYLVSWILQDDKIFDNKIDLQGIFSCIIPLVNTKQIFCNIIRNNRTCRENSFWDEKLRIYFLKMICHGRRGIPLGNNQVRLREGEGREWPHCVPSVLRASLRSVTTRWCLQSRIIRMVTVTNTWGLSATARKR